MVRVDIPAPPARDIIAEDIPIAIAYEDEHLLVVDKPAGMVVHPAPGNWTGTLVNALLGRGTDDAGGAGEIARERAGIVHRLDKETSGLLIVARTERAHTLLSAAIASRRVARRYAAMIAGHLGADRLTVEKPIVRDPRDRKRMAVVSIASGAGSTGAPGQRGGRSARTDFTRLARFASGDLLRAQLHTGRTHQIRVHLASIGHPVLGDDVYGGGDRRAAALPPRRHFLHAAWLRFRHPVTGSELDVRSPLPPDLTRSLTAIAEASDYDLPANPLDSFGFFDDAR